MSFDFFQNSTEEPAFQTNWNLSKPKKRGVKKYIYKVKFCEEGDLGFFLVDAPQKKMEKSVFFFICLRKAQVLGANNFTYDVMSMYEAWV